MRNAPTLLVQGPVVTRFVWGWRFSTAVCFLRGSVEPDAVCTHCYGGLPFPARTRWDGIHAAVPSSTGNSAAAAKLDSETGAVSAIHVKKFLSAATASEELDVDRLREL